MKIIVALLGSLAISSLGFAGESSNLVSYNIRFAAKTDLGTRAWDARKEQVATYLSESKCDIFGLQEVLQHQLLHVQKALPEYRYIGVGREDGKTKGEYCPLFYDLAKWTADTDEQGTFWLSETPDIPGSTSWGNEIPRVCSWARLVNKEGKGIYVYNNHFDHQSQNSREKSAVLMLKKIKERKHLKEPVVVMGDLNAYTTNPAIKTLLEPGDFIDHGGAKQMSTSSRWLPALVPGMRIDHIFTSPGVKVKEFKVESNGDPVAGSDHHPVILRGVAF